MSKIVSDTDMSEIEKEVELEAEGSTEEPEVKEREYFGYEGEAEGSTEEPEVEEREYFGYEGEAEGLTEEPEVEEREYFGYEGEAEGLTETETDEREAYFVNRFYELSQMEFESEYEVDENINKLLQEMEREYFFKNLWKKAKSAGKSLIKKGLKLSKGLPFGAAISGITQLARGNLKGALASLAKSGLLNAAASVIPGGSVALPALKAAGIFELGEDSQETSKEGWRTFVNVGKEAYEYLARNMNESTDKPQEANKLATQAFQHALAGVSRGPGRAIYPSRTSKKKRYRMRVKRGEVINLRIIGI